MPTSSTLLTVAIALLIAFSFTAHPAPSTSRARRTLLAGVAVLIVLWFLSHFRSILAPFVVPLILAYLLDPVLDSLERRGHTRVRAILVVYAAVLLLMVVAALLVVPPLLNQVGSILRPLASGKTIDLVALGQYVEFPDKLLKGLEKSLLDRGVKPEWVQSLADNLYAYRLDEKLQLAGAWLVEQLTALVGWLQRQVSGLMWLVLLPITLYYCLRDFDPLRRRLYYLVPRQRRGEVAQVAGQINQALGRYLRGYAMLSLAMGVLQTCLLLGFSQLFGFRYALVMGLLAGVTYIIPYIGSFVGTVVTTLVVFVTGGHSFLEAGLVWAVCQGLNSLFDQIISPRVIGKEVGLHPLVVMFALLAGGSQFGLLGVILATPVTACGKILLSHFVPRLSEPIPEDETPEAAASADEPSPPTPAADDRSDTEHDRRPNS